jgi:hypothetical protein
MNPPNTTDTRCVLTKTARNEYKFYSTPARIIIFIPLRINILKPSGFLRTTRLNIQKFYLVLVLR